jgi:hypothetical protein
MEVTQSLGVANDNKPRGSSSFLGFFSSVEDDDKLGGS